MSDVAGNSRRLRVYVAMAMFAVGCSSTLFAASPYLATDATSAQGVLQQAAASAAQERGKSGVRAWLREKMVGESDLECYGLQLDDCWDGESGDDPTVILIHGFNSAPDRNTALLAPIHAAQIPCGSFSYPNDYEILSSAQLLSCELRRFAKRYPDCRVVLLCHSMGGLVARACVENPSLDPGNVDRLIMIAPPTHGTLVAHFAVGTDLWEHWLSRKSGGPWRRMRDSVIDGLGEAADELCPNSPFLNELNGRPRNPRVRYTIVLGTGALVNEAQLLWIRHSIRECLAKLPGTEANVERLDAILSDVDELVDGRGDGVVAVKRGRLQGVSDTLVMPFGHLAVAGEPSDEVLRNLHAEVLKRVH
jgi:pimeloyl-ACP methyl ester carboxylesterase